MAKPRNSETAPLVNPLEAHLGYQLRRASVFAMTDLGTRLTPTGLRPSEVAVLMVIRANSGCQQGAIGELLGIKSANMVPLVARLDGPFRVPVGFPGSARSLAHLTSIK